MKPADITLTCENGHVILANSKDHRTDCYRCDSLKLKISSRRIA